MKTRVNENWVEDPVLTLIFLVVCGCFFVPTMTSAIAALVNGDLLWGHILLAIAFAIGMAGARCKIRVKLREKVPEEQDCQRV